VCTFRTLDLPKTRPYNCAIIPHFHEEVSRLVAALTRIWSGRLIFQTIQMKKNILTSLLLASAIAIILPACAMVTQNLATPERIAKLPEPIRSQVQQLVRQQQVLAHHFTAGTRKMIEGYATIAEAIDMKIEAAKLRAESKALNAGSSLDDTRKALSRSAPLIKEVRSKLSASKGVTLQSKAKFVEGHRIKNEAYVLELQLAEQASVQAVVGINAMRKASTMDKVLLTATLDPMFFFAKDVPNFLAEERNFEGICQQFAKNYNISIPKQSLPTPKLSNIAF